MDNNQELSPNFWYIIGNDGGDPTLSVIVAAADADSPLRVKDLLDAKSELDGLIKTLGWKSAPSTTSSNSTWKSKPQSTSGRTTATTSGDKPPTTVVMCDMVAIVRTAKAPAVLFFKAPTSDKVLEYSAATLYLNTDKDTETFTKFMRDAYSKSFSLPGAKDVTFKDAKRSLGEKQDWAMWLQSPIAVEYKVVEKDGRSNNYVTRYGFDD